MTRTLCLVAMLTLGACAPLSAVTGSPGQASNAEVLKALGEHLDKCERHYQGSVGLGANFTFDIDCKGQAASAPTI